MEKGKVRGFVSVNDTLDYKASRDHPEINYHFHGFHWVNGAPNVKIINLGMLAR